MCGIPIDVRAVRKRAKRMPALLSRAFIVTSDWTLQFHDIDLAVTREIQKLSSPRSGQAAAGYRRECIDRTEARTMPHRLVIGNAAGERRDVVFVEPCFTQLGEHTRHPFSVEIQPSVHAPVDPGWQLLEA